MIFVAIPRWWRATRIDAAADEDEEENADEFATSEGSDSLAPPVAGADKAQPLKGVLEGPYEPEQLPSQLILSAAAKILWLVDTTAAKLLSITKEEHA